ncbi:hypothetical protein ACIRL2_29200 [Embleya sp. NPDC127516]|uniref:hypothetical protein n=1 Tax=Embleya sp. NPDC127516 TaxID=3363990 RepID=UPI003829733B
MTIPDSHYRLVDETGDTLYIRPLDETGERGVAITTTLDGVYVRPADAKKVVAAIRRACGITGEPEPVDRVDLGAVEADLAAVARIQDDEATTEELARVDPAMRRLLDEHAPTLVAAVKRLRADLAMQDTATIEAARDQDAADQDATRCRRALVDLRTEADTAVGYLVGYATRILGRAQAAETRVTELTDAAGLDREAERMQMLGALHRSAEDDLSTAWATSLTYAAQQIEALPQDHELDPGRGESVALLRALVAEHGPAGGRS